jgi:catalase
VRTSEQAIDVIHGRFGTHPRHRALHAKGVWARGVFRAAPEAAALSRAAHLQGEDVPVVVRLSNGGGDPDVPDYVPDVRGMAVSFELPGGNTDLVSQSVPRFFASSPDEFLDFVKAGSGRFAALQLPRFLATHPKALRHLPANAPALRPIASFARCRFYGVHAFAWVDAEGRRSHVRCDWRPEAGERRLNPAAARKLGRDYLGEELAQRLADGPVRWTLDAQIASPGDDVDDPSQHWADDRRRVDAGVLELREMTADPESGGAVVVFDPVRLTDGIELTDDPVLRFRPKAYSVSADLRSA